MFWRLLARDLARESVVNWLIQRAMRTPYLHIICPDGSIYMERYWLFNAYPVRESERGKGWRSWLPSVRLHRIMRPDSDRHLHDHPWSARTIILRGWYEETRQEKLGYRKLKGKPIGYKRKMWLTTFRRLAGNTATLAFEEYHQITQVSDGGVWTLFITWRKQGSWGFDVDGVKVNWRTYLGIED